MENLDLTALLLSALKVSGPIFGWVILGAIFGRFGWLSPELINRISRISFMLALPVVLFVGAAQVDYAGIGKAAYLFAGIIATALTVCLSWIYGRWRDFPRQHLGLFVQGAFRSNLGIIGVALCISAYGDRGLVLAALPIAVLTILYNILAVLVLDSTLERNSSLVSMLLGILKNPLIIGIAAGGFMSALGVAVPSPIVALGGGISTYFIPLMLLCIGGSIRISGLRSLGSLTWEACAWRLLVSPVLAVIIALLLGVRGEPLGVLFLLMASPVAAASFVMVVAARGDGTMAANMVVLTTLLSLVSVTAGFFLLSVLGLVSD